MTCFAWLTLYDETSLSRSRHFARLTVLRNTSRRGSEMRVQTVTACRGLDSSPHGERATPTARWMIRPRPHAICACCHTAVDDFRELSLDRAICYGATTARYRSSNE